MHEFGLGLAFSVRVYTTHCIHQHGPLIIMGRVHISVGVEWSDHVVRPGHRWDRWLQWVGITASIFLFFCRAVVSLSRLFKSFERSFGFLVLFLFFFFFMIPRLAFYLFDFRHEKKNRSDKFRTGGVYFRVRRQGVCLSLLRFPFFVDKTGSTGVVMGQSRGFCFSGICKAKSSSQESRKQRMREKSPYTTHPHKRKEEESD